LGDALGFKDYAVDYGVNNGPWPTLGMPRLYKFVRLNLEMMILNNKFKYGKEDAQ
jgi:hypothetical protein